MALIFSLGMISDRFLFSHPMGLERGPTLARSSSSQAASCTAGSPVSSVGLGGRVADSISNRSAAPDRNSSKGIDPPSVGQFKSEIKLVPPTGNLPEILDDATERKLIQIAEGPAPTLTKSSKVSNEDGSLELYGTTADGAKFFAHVNPKNEMTKEGWNLENGDNVYRAYYETGQIKAMSWNRADHSLTSLNFTETGLYESRYDRLADESTFSTSYDDSGRVKEVWKTVKGGKPVKVQNLP